MTLEEAINIVVAQTRNERYRYLCSEENPDQWLREAYRQQMFNIAETGHPASRPMPPYIETMQTVPDQKASLCVNIKVNGCKPNYPGCTVTLTSTTDSTQIISGVTDSTGTFTYQKLGIPGLYSLHITEPSGRFVTSYGNITVSCNYSNTFTLTNINTTLYQCTSCCFAPIKRTLNLSDGVYPSVVLTYSTSTGTWQGSQFVTVPSCAQPGYPCACPGSEGNTTQITYTGPCGFGVGWQGGSTVRVCPGTNQIIPTTCPVPGAGPYQSNCSWQGYTITCPESGGFHVTGGGQPATNCSVVVGGSQPVVPAYAAIYCTTPNFVCTD